jgi:succinate dehydrogenase / fumarate reductase flavoprotein subunit
MIWSGPGRIEREPVPPVPDEIATLIREVSTTGELVE